MSDTNEVIVTSIDEENTTSQNPEEGHNTFVDIKTKLENLLNTKRNIVYKTDIRTKVEYKYTTEKKYVEDILKFFDTRVEARGDDIFHLELAYDLINRELAAFKSEPHYVPMFTPKEVEKIYQCINNLSVVRGLTQIYEKLRLLFPLDLTMNETHLELEAIKKEYEENASKYKDILEPETEESPVEEFQVETSES